MQDKSNSKLNNFKSIYESNITKIKSDYETQLAGAKETVDKLLQENEGLRNRLDNLMKENTRLKSEIEKLEAEKIDSDRQITTLNQQLESLKLQLKVRETQSRQTDEDKEGYEKMIKDLNNQIKGLKEQLQKQIEEDKNVVKKMSEEYIEQLEALQQQLANQIEADKAAFDKLNSNYMAQIESLQNQLKSQIEKDKLEYNKMVSSYTKQITTLQTRYNSTVSSGNNEALLNNKIMELTSQIQALQREIVAKDRIIAQLTSEKQVLNMKVESLGKTFGLEIERLKQKVIILNQKIIEKYKEIDYIIKTYKIRYSQKPVITETQTYRELTKTRFLSQEVAGPEQVISQRTIGTYQIPAATLQEIPGTGTTTTYREHNFITNGTVNGAVDLNNLGAVTNINSLAASELPVVNDLSQVGNAQILSSSNNITTSHLNSIQTVIPDNGNIQLNQTYTTSTGPINNVRQMVHI